MDLVFCIFTFFIRIWIESSGIEWVDWFNKIRAHSTIGYVSPFEFEKRYYDNLNLLGEAA